MTAPAHRRRLLEGVYPALVTPFASDGSVALDAVERLTHESLAAGCAGVVALGTTGEAPALDADEQRAVIDVCARVCAEHDAQLIVGAGTNSTAKTIAAVEALAGTPALAAALIVVPYYVRPSEAGIIAHLQAVAAASPVPVELARTPNIVGMKQAVGALDADTLEILAGAPHDFCVLGGDDAFFFPTVLMGGAGAISAAANLLPARFAAMVDCGLAGKLDDGRAHAEALLPVVQAGFAEPNPSVFKGVLHAQGRIPTPDVRLPLVAASSGAVERALAAVEAAESRR